ncbi:MAG: hypothetical protein AAFY56_14705 [Pseudomonadota bacterium]
MTNPMQGFRWGWAQRSAPSYPPISDAKVLEEKQEAARPPSERQVQQATRGAFAIGAPISASFMGLLMAQAMASPEPEGPVSTGEGVLTPEDGALDPIMMSSGAGEFPLGADAMLDNVVPTAASTTVTADFVGELNAPPSISEFDATTSDLAAVDQELVLATATAEADNSVEINLGLLGEEPLPDPAPLDEPFVGDIGGPIGEVLIGTEQDEELVGSDANDSIDGRGGNDILRGGAGDDDLLGGEGNDQIFAGDGLDELDGGAGNDILEGQLGNDRLYGGIEGDDILFGGAGEDELRGGIGADLLDGGEGADRMIGGTGSDTYVVDHRNDIILEDRLGPEQGGRDTVEISSDFDQSIGGEATIIVGTDQVPDDAALNGTRKFLGNNLENAHLEGSASHDLVGSEDDNELFGNAGDNRIHGADGADTLFGEAGSDVIYGGEGDDFIDGGAGDDLLYGGAGDDTFALGLSENDADTIFDHEGNNTIRIDGVDLDKLQAVEEEGDLTLKHEDSVIGRVDGWADHRDALAGIDDGNGLRPVSDFMDGDTDPDDVPPDQTILGTAGNDRLLGTDGNDRIDGGGGSDRFEGGAGNDTYVFDAEEPGVGKIADTQGFNSIEVQNYAIDDLSGLAVSDDFWLLGGGQPFAIIEDYAGNEAAWASVKADGQDISDKVFG